MLERQGGSPSRRVQGWGPQRTGSQEPGEGSCRLPCRGEGMGSCPLMERAAAGGLPGQGTGTWVSSSLVISTRGGAFRQFQGAINQPLSSRAGVGSPLSTTNQPGRFAHLDPRACSRLGEENAEHGLNSSAGNLSACTGG